MKSHYDKAFILTDSNSSVMAMATLFPRNEIIKEIFTEMIINPTKSIYVAWIKAHIGTFGNERADTLAKEVIENNTFNLSLKIPFPISLIKKNKRDNILKSWQNYWENSDRGRDTYNVIKNVSLDYLCKNQVSAYFITGHGSFPSFLHKIKKKSNDLCICGRRGDVIHYLFGNCPEMPAYFNFDSSKTVRENMYQILHNNSSKAKLKSIYNKLNKLYSFVKYVF